MVAVQLVGRGIRDTRVLQAMAEVPRHLFVPEEEQRMAYADCALGIGEGQTISQPYMVALMTERLALTGREKVLEVGTGSGYQAAILAGLAATVFSIERIPALARRAEAVLGGLGIANVRVVVGDGSLGLPGEAPFDRILVTAGVPRIPERLVEQLIEGGILVAPVGELGFQTLMVGVKGPAGLSLTESVDCVFVPLIGEAGWKAGWFTEAA